MTSPADKKFVVVSDPNNPTMVTGVLHDSEEAAKAEKKKVISEQASGPSTDSQPVVRQVLHG